jgi:hypothetical protein
MATRAVRSALQTRVALLLAGGLPALLLAGGPAAAQSAERERDEQIFGSPADTPASMPVAAAPRAATTPQPPATPDLERRLLQLGDDRLQVGGLMLMRFNWNLTNGDSLADHRIGMPNLVDVYLDARPTDRVRGFVRGRLLWDPSLDASDPLVRAQGGEPTRVQLNELWLKFDIGRRVFVTLGQQLLLWGASRLWNPTDVINQTLRPVLSPFDQRNGRPLLKLQLPIESLGWNLYAIGVLDRVDSLDEAGIVGRAELVFSTVELGIVGAYRDEADPVVGLDLSAGVLDFDLTSEASLRIDDRFDHGVALQTTAGIAYNLSVFDDDMLIFGGEYFYNQLGARSVDPLELFSGARQFFYAGRHYLALFATLPRPSTLDDWIFTLSGVGNLSDKSFIARFDLSVQLLTYLTLQAFVVAHFGRAGELRIGDAAFPEASRAIARTFYNPDDPTQPVPTQVVDLGLWLSLDL